MEEVKGKKIYYCIFIHDNGSHMITKNYNANKTTKRNKQEKKQKRFTRKWNYQNKGKEQIVGLYFSASAESEKIK